MVWASWERRALGHKLCNSRTSLVFPFSNNYKKHQKHIELIVRVWFVTDLKKISHKSSLLAYHQQDKEIDRMILSKMTSPTAILYDC